ncbi:DUF2690 domain-containing protein [Streptomyces sp. NPDC047000]|uniref:DUF2690 domain-containing protein n=1 Tax=Streptomyces sp. NPDC047000 TaxID=3155474 RepID=UPI0033C7280F
MTRSTPSPSAARLAVVLRQQKQLTGLSLAQLAHATTFSKSSWERYLNGKSLPPRSAVEELCRLAGESARHPLALLDIARTEHTEQTDRIDRTDAPAPASTTAPPATAPSDLSSSGASSSDVGRDRTGPAGHRYATVLTALASACAVALAVLVLVRLPPSPREEPSPSPTHPPATGVLCRHTACQNQDPITMQCAADPLTLAEHRTATGAWVQIRYSEECGTSWARMWGAVVDDSVEIRAVGRTGSLHGARVTSRDEADTYVHTLMSVVSPGMSLQACFSPAAGGGKECFRTTTDRTGHAS